jgi:Flp pilus assembly protein TadD
MADLVRRFAVVVAVLMAVTTARRNTVWASEYALWADAARKAPQKTRPFINLGIARESAGDLAGARAAYAQAFALAFDGQRRVYDREYARSAAMSNLAHLEARAGHLTHARAMLDGVLTDWPGFTGALFNRAAVERLQGDVAACHADLLALQDPDVLRKASCDAP